MAALTPDALWIQDTWELRRFPLLTLDNIETGKNGNVLNLTFSGDPSPIRLNLIFASAAEGERWRDELMAQQQAGTGAATFEGNAPEGVALVRNAPEVPHEVLTRMQTIGPNRWAAVRRLQLQAGIRGADAVLEFDCRRYPDLGWSARQVSGLVVRVPDADSRNRLRLTWYAEEVRALVKRMFLLLILQTSLLLLVAGLGPGITNFQAPTGETASEWFKTSALWIGLFFSWPLVMVVLLYVLRWHQLLRPAGLGVLAATAGRGLTVTLAHLFAILASGVAPAGSWLWITFDPFEWAFIIFGLILGLRAWRLASEAPQILPRNVQFESTARKAGSRTVFAATGIYALALLGLVGVSRYQESAYLLEPGVDPKREHQALLAFNEGADRTDRGELDSAEQQFQKSLRLWEQLTERRSAPSNYWENLATTLYNLGWIRERQNRLDQAEQFYSRAVAIADRYANDPQMSRSFKKTMDGARQSLAAIRAGQSNHLLQEKEKEASRKFEEAQVKAEKGDAAAESLYRRAIDLWEEVLPKATNPKYQRGAPTHLAGAFLTLADFQQRLGKRAEAETSLQKSIEYGEKAADREPDRPLALHNLDVARRMLDSLREQSFHDEISKLCDMQRFADAIDLSLRSIEEQEEQLRSSKDQDAAGRRLAYRLDRFAWLLGHCPDDRTRDTKAAVKHARRATELQPDVGDYWYTLAMVQYRNGSWRDSLASLEKVKAKEKEYDASDWFLVAMNRHQLKQKDEARAAFRKAIDYIEEQQRKAEDNALLRFQFEMARPAIEALRREAETLIQGKDPANQSIGYRPKERWPHLCYSGEILEASALGNPESGPRKCATRFYPSCLSHKARKEMEKVTGIGGCVFPGAGPSGTGTMVPRTPRGVSHPI
jgi:tetratricopeptide (TPR) repeat protein